MLLAVAPAVEIREKIVRTRRAVDAIAAGPVAFGLLSGTLQKERQR
jgi:hypothetical protein